MFYKCKHCGNITTFLHNSGVKTVCCGEQMEELIPNTSDGAGEKHVPVIKIKECDDDTLKGKVEIGEIDHPMTPEHYIQWIYIQTKNGGQFKHLTPDDKPKAKFILKKDELLAAYEYCNLHGLWKKEI